jgi:hypothetical protein
MRVEQIGIGDAAPCRFDVRVVVFSLGQARRALPYVARLMRDANRAYQRVQDVRALLADVLNHQQATELIRQRDYAIHRLNEIIDECNAVGLAHIHIPHGLAAFRAEIDSRPITLMWRIGEPVEMPWPDLDAATVTAADRIDRENHAPPSPRPFAHAAR